MSLFKGVNNWLGLKSTKNNVRTLTSKNFI